MLDGIRACAGALLLTASGTVLGTCGTLGNEARELTSAEIAGLEETSRRVVLELERHTLD